MGANDKSDKLNGENSEMEIVVEIKFKITPSSEMFALINRLLPDKTQWREKPNTCGCDNHTEVESMEGGEAVVVPVQTTTHSSPDDKGKQTTGSGVDTGHTPVHDQPLREIEKIDKFDYIKDPVDVPGFKNLSYAETIDKRVKIIYGSARVNTTWADIHTICKCEFKQQTKDAIERLVGHGRAKNKYTAVNRFVKAVSDGVVSPYKSTVPINEDPDAAYKPILQGIIDTKVGDDVGKVE